MKPLFIPIVSLFASAVMSTSIYATDWIYDFAKAPSSNWTSSIGTSETAGYWYDKNDTSNYIKGSFSADDTFTIGDTVGTANSTLTLNQNVTIKSLTLTGKGYSNSARINGAAYTLETTGDLIHLGESGHTFLEMGNLIVHGEIKNANNMQFVGKSVVVDKNVSGGSLYFTATSNKTNLADGIANPDMWIKGYVNDCNLYINTVTTGNNYTKLSGVTGTASINHGAQNGRNYIGYAILTNTIDCSATGAINESSYPNVYTPTSGKLSIVMNGSATQNFTSSATMFFGGVKAMSGTIRFNFNQYASTIEKTHYWYWIDSATTIKRTAWTTADSSGKATQFSHGDLEMLGGTFGTVAGDNTYGSFRFTNIVYTSGTINLRLTSSSKFDQLDLTSYYFADMLKSDDSVTYNTGFAEGGKLSKTEGAGKVTFDFGNSLSWLIDSEGIGIKIISWDASKKTDLTADDFAANKFTGSDNKLYEAAFTTADDGLYVKYVAAVPEASTMAGIFGILALAFAAYRRKK